MEIGGDGSPGKVQRTGVGMSVCAFASSLTMEVLAIWDLASMLWLWSLIGSISPLD